MLELFFCQLQQDAQRKHSQSNLAAGKRKKLKAQTPDISAEVNSSTVPGHEHHSFSNPLWQHSSHAELDAAPECARLRQHSSTQSSSELSIIGMLQAEPTRQLPSNSSSCCTATCTSLAVPHPHPSTQSVKANTTDSAQNRAEASWHPAVSHTLYDGMDCCCGSCCFDVEASQACVPAAVLPKRLKESGLEGQLMWGAMYPLQKYASFLALGGVVYDTCKHV